MVSPETMGKKGDARLAAGAVTRVLHSELSGMGRILVALLIDAVATVVSLIAVIILAFKGLILWNYGILMIIGAILGGYLGGRFAKGLSKQTLRYFVLATASFFTVVYFWTTYVHPSTTRINGV